MNARANALPGKGDRVSVDRRSDQAIHGRHGLVEEIGTNLQGQKVATVKLDGGAVVGVLLHHLVREIVPNVGWDPAFDAHSRRAFVPRNVFVL